MFPEFNYRKKSEGKGKGFFRTRKTEDQSFMTNF